MTIDEAIALLENVQRRRHQWIEQYGYREDHWKSLLRNIAELKAARENERLVSQQ